MLPYPFTFISAPIDLTCEFFAVFSRVALALKELSFVKIEGRASPDW
jgi:hypothetical protein